MGTRVTQSLHPYLDYSVVQAVIQECFPRSKNGKPVEAAFPYEYPFETFGERPARKRRATRWEGNDGFRQAGHGRLPEAPITANPFRTDARFNQNVN